ncbi:uncharacterized protein BO66DRAFT_237449 [Aspergillus aculeatinus CBS 121060]|uniref:Uncharacterized protein n=1 Tax=Aspergillus aculeatinus CBS 121060 TaxID=1448322 RepID=A0ACD1HHY7_9EURO|nr:hypothetical protein BO66DRAFT_237449 [Aspergillus aculeatinus CBS 121060]RAH73205.1 hypothetical protein BO66DRAFT_237449 [Aspergillus aculeatinus CBS 121060]
MQTSRNWGGPCRTRMRIWLSHPTPFMPRPAPDGRHGLLKGRGWIPFHMHLNTCTLSISSRRLKVRVVKGSLYPSLGLYFPRGYRIPRAEMYFIAQIRYPPVRETEAVERYSRLAKNYQSSMTSARVHHTLNAAVALSKRTEAELHVYDFLWTLTFNLIP